MRITDVLAGLDKDPQVKEVTAKLAADADKKSAKTAAEKKAIAGPADPEQEIEAQMGSTSMDARAKLHAKALRAAGKEREMQTWNDPNEQLNQRGTGASPKPPVQAVQDNERGSRASVNKALPSASGKTASEKSVEPKTIKRASLAEWAAVVSKDNGEKLASEQFSKTDLFDIALQHDTYRFMGAANAVGEIKASLYGE